MGGALLLGRPSLRAAAAACPSEAEPKARQGLGTPRLKPDSQAPLAGRTCSTPPPPRGARPSPYDLTQARGPGSAGGGGQLTEGARVGGDPAPSAAPPTPARPPRPAADGAARPLGASPGRRDPRRTTQVQRGSALPAAAPAGPCPERRQRSAARPGRRAPPPGPGRSGAPPPPSPRGPAAGSSCSPRRRARALLAPRPSPSGWRPAWSRPSPAASGPRTPPTCRAATGRVRPRRPAHAPRGTSQRREAAAIREERCARRGGRGRLPSGTAHPRPAGEGLRGTGCSSPFPAARGSRVRPRPLRAARLKRRHRESALRRLNMTSPSHATFLATPFPPRPWYVPAQRASAPDRQRSGTAGGGDGSAVVRTLQGTRSGCAERRALLPPLPAATVGCTRAARSGGRAGRGGAGRQTPQGGAERRRRRWRWLWCSVLRSGGEAAVVSAWHRRARPRRELVVAGPVLTAGGGAAAAVTLLPFAVPLLQQRLCRRRRCQRWEVGGETNREEKVGGEQLCDPQLTGVGWLFLPTSAAAASLSWEQNGARRSSYCCNFKWILDAESANICRDFFQCGRWRGSRFRQVQVCKV